MLSPNTAPSSVPSQKLPILNAVVSCVPSSAPNEGNFQGSRCSSPYNEHCNLSFPRRCLCEANRNYTLPFSDLCCFIMFGGVKLKSRNPLGITWIAHIFHERGVEVLVFWQSVLLEIQREMMRVDPNGSISALLPKPFLLSHTSFILFCDSTSRLSPNSTPLSYHPACANFLKYPSLRVIRGGDDAHRCLTPSSSSSHQTTRPE